VPAAAVIPAPIAYIKVVAVKKLVVEPLSCPGGPDPSWFAYCLTRSLYGRMALRGVHAPASERG
jgi:hypothetical protein